MREILFRGRRKDLGTWIHGDLEYNRMKGFARIHQYDSLGGYVGQYEVDPVTVGQYTGLKDRNGTEIYEGDIVVYGGECKHVVEFKHGMFGYTTMDGWFYGYGGNPNFTFNPLDKSEEHEVIGNIHERKEK